MKKDEKKPHTEKQENSFHNESMNELPNNPSQNEEVAADKPSPTELLQQEIKQLKEENEKLKNTRAYLQADYENTKKRFLRDQEETIKYATEKIITSLLDIYDQIEQAIVTSEAYIQSQKNAKDILAPFLQGIQLTHKNLLTLLSKEGVELVGAVGDIFNPHLHEAVSEKKRTEENSSLKEGEILEVYQKGCLFKGKLIRPARVLLLKD